MHHRTFGCHRRHFLKLTAFASVALPSLPSWAATSLVPERNRRSDAKVAIVPCRTYQREEIKAALGRSFDLLGGLGRLVRQKTVTIKINLTGTNFLNYLGRPVGETYMTHGATALALAGLMFQAGARRVRFVESTNSRSELATSLEYAGWDVKGIRSLGLVEFENTRNLGFGKQYATLKVPSGGAMFSSLDLNHSYSETDVLVSLCKLKNHITVGVTLSMKNLFGITPNSLYSGATGHEDATDGRFPIHGPDKDPGKPLPGDLRLPGLKGKFADVPRDPGYRVPRTIVDICAARPIDLAIIDGITAMEGGEGPWCEEANPVKVTTPGVIIAGTNPVSTDAVATAVMGYPDPRALRGTNPFKYSDNHILLAEQAGLGLADLSAIEVLGQPIKDSVCKYRMRLENPQA